MSQSPVTTSPVKTTDVPESTPLDVTPITTIHPEIASFINPKPKKSTAQRPKISMKSATVIPKSKKNSKTSSSSVSKKTSKAKSTKSKTFHTMQELYVDDISDQNAESNVEASRKVASDLSAEKEKGTSEVDAETLEIQKGVSAEKSSNSKIV
jgi:hypothetical protein